MVNNKPILLVVGLIVAAACGWQLIRHQSPINRADSMSSTMDSGQERLPRHGSAQRETSGREIVGSSSRSEFESTPDLFRFASELAARASTNDPEALWLIRRAREYCAAFSSDPNKYVSDTTVLASLANATASQSVKVARERTAARCTGFSNQAYGIADDINALQQAAKVGSVSAEAALLTMGRPIDKSPEYKTDLVRRVLESHDPESYLALSESMRTTTGSNAVQSSFSGDQNAVLAWQLAACNQGLDCRATGSLMTSYCANGGICGNYRNFQDLVFNGIVARSDLPRIEFYLKQIQQIGDSNGTNL